MHKVNTEIDLQVYLGSMCTTVGTYWLRPRNPPPPPSPAFGLINEGAIGQPRQTTSLCDPLGTCFQESQQFLEKKYSKEKVRADNSFYSTALRTRLIVYIGEIFLTLY
jgi:hypothetical protein